MILEQQVNNAEYIGDVVENKVGIDTKNVDFITTLLTSNLYSKPFASFLRETISNAYDSHIEAGTKEPIILLIENGQSYDYLRVSIRDFGTGISPERFEKIYKYVGSSTKRESNDYIGAFGIGKFSCLSCSDVATVISYYNGIKYSYVMYKNNGGINIDKTSEEKGNFKNGLEVSIELSISRNDFKDAIESLYLFNNLYIENKYQDYRLRGITDAFNAKVVNDHGDYYTIDCHPFTARNSVAIGNVLYPIETYRQLSTTGIIIKVPIGSVDITPNRETLQFTERTKKVIESKINSIKATWASEAVKNLTDTDLKTFFEYASQNWVTINDTRVHKEDVSLDNSLIRIDGVIPPANYSLFLSRLKYVTVPRSLIYKNLCVNYSRRSVVFGNLLSSEYKFGLKKDQVTKAITLSYYRETFKDSVIFNYSSVAELLEPLCSDLKNTVYGFDENELKTHIDFTLNHIPITYLSNAAVPEEYIKAIKEAERNKKKMIEPNNETIRVFDKYGFKVRDLSGFIDHELQYCPFVVYAANSRDDNKLYQKIAGVLAQYQQERRYIYPKMITVKSSVIDMLKGRKKFVHVTDFLYLRNNFWSKLLTAKIIYDNLHMREFDHCIRLNSIPMWKEYTKKYHKQLACIYELIELPVYEDLKNLYTTKHWINEYDINYFSLSKEQIDRITELRSLLDFKEEVVYGVIFKKYGKDEKLGINTPNSHIYKYIKL